MATINDNVKNEMLLGISSTLTDVQLKYQDGTTSTATTEAQLWDVPASGNLTQKTDVVFSIDTSSGDINVSGFNLIFTSGSVAGISFNFTDIYNYNNNGSFTFSDMTIVVN